MADGEARVKSPGEFTREVPEGRSARPAAPQTVEPTTGRPGAGGHGPEGPGPRGALARLRGGTAMSGPRREDEERPRRPPPADRPGGPEADDDELDHRFAADEEVADDPAGSEEARTPGQGS